MSRPAEELVRPWQLLPPAQARIPIDATLTSGKTPVTKATVFDPSADIVGATPMPQGGRNYAPDDVIFPAGGAGISAVLRVAEVDVSGAILTLTIDSGGSYTILPPPPSYQKSTSGAGTGAQFALTGSGGAPTVTLKIGGVGKLPSPVSDTVGVSVCNETWEEVPGTRKTHNDKVFDDTGSGAFITVARTTGTKFKKANNENMLGTTNFTYAQDISAALNDLSSQFTPLAGSGFQDAPDSRTGKCNVGMTMHNPV